jgi:NADH-quinone oxidoreductase subunit N
MEQLLRDVVATAPITGTLTLALVVIMINAFARNSFRLEYAVSLLGIAANIGLAVWVWPWRGTAFGGAVTTGGAASLFAVISLVAAGLTILLGYGYVQKIGARFGEFFAVVLIAAGGMMAFASAADLLTMFVGLELMSICLYVLAGMTRGVPRSNEASLKYFLLGSFSTGFFLYGVALIYGTSGSTSIPRIAQQAAVLSADPLFLVGAGLLLTGFAFKVGAVPFHMWVPDVYEGSPTVVSAFMSTGGKAAAFGALVVFFLPLTGLRTTAMADAAALLALVTMAVGNLAALAQDNVKRMLAYSSIAHAGYMLIGVASGTAAGAVGIAFYLVSYLFTNMGAFGVVSVVEDASQGSTDIGAFTGLFQRRPFLASMLAVFLFSLIGLPPFAGFFGKYYLFIAAIENGYTWLAIAGVITSMISVYFYLRVVVTMFFRAPETEDAHRAGVSGAVALVLCAVCVLLIGLLPSILLDILTGLF